MKNLNNTKPAPRYITGEWAHIFADKSIKSEKVRVVFDRVTNSIAAMNIILAAGEVDAPAWARNDVLDSIINANSDAIDNPESYDLEAVSEIPAWAFRFSPGFRFTELEDGSYELFYMNRSVTTCNRFDDIVAAACGIEADVEDKK